MSWLSRLFGSAGGGDDAPSAEPEIYKGFSIRPEPMPDAGGFRIAAMIEKDGRSHHLIRADVIRDRDEAVAASLAKARQMIDEQGERIF